MELSLHHSKVFDLKSILLLLMYVYLSHCILFFSSICSNHLPGCYVQNFRIKFIIKELKPLIIFLAVSLNRFSNFLPCTLLFSIESSRKECNYNRANSRSIFKTHSVGDAGNPVCSR